MKIERINDNSIRCTLTSFDLSVRNLNIRELAYGTEKAKKLFEEMMTRASDEVGFSVENSPLMIEAIPMNSDSVQLIISKVDDPEELDARFSKFTKNPEAGNINHGWLNKLTSELLEGAGSIFGQLQKLAPAEKKPDDTDLKDDIAPNVSDNAAEKDGSEKHISVIAVTDNRSSQGKNKESSNAPQAEFRAFIFRNLDEVITACKAASSFGGNSILYKKPDGQNFVLVLEGKDIPKDQFSKTCNLLAEFGRMLKTVSATVSYFDEHYTVISKESAIQKLSQI